MRGRAPIAGGELKLRRLSHPGVPDSQEIVGQAVALCRCLHLRLAWASKSKKPNRALRSRWTPFKPRVPLTKTTTCSKPPSEFGTCVGVTLLAVQDMCHLLSLCLFQGQGLQRGESRELHALKQGSSSPSLRFWEGMLHFLEDQMSSLELSSQAVTCNLTQASCGKVWLEHCPKHALSH